MHRLNLALDGIHWASSKNEFSVPLAWNLWNRVWRYRDTIFVHIFALKEVPRLLWGDWCSWKLLDLLFSRIQLSCYYSAQNFVRHKVMVRNSLIKAFVDMNQEERITIQVLQLIEKGSLSIQTCQTRWTTGRPATLIEFVTFGRFLQVYMNRSENLSLWLYPLLFCLFIKALTNCDVHWWPSPPNRIQLAGSARGRTGVT